MRRANTHDRSTCSIGWPSPRSVASDSEATSSESRTGDPVTGGSTNRVYARSIDRRPASEAASAVAGTASVPPGFVRTPAPRSAGSGREDDQVEHADADLPPERWVGHHGRLPRDRGIPARSEPPANLAPEVCGPTTRPISDLTVARTTVERAREAAGSSLRRGPGRRPGNRRRRGRRRSAASRGGSAAGARGRGRRPATTPRRNPP